MSNNRLYKIDFGYEAKLTPEAAELLEKYSGIKIGHKADGTFEQYYHTFQLTITEANSLGVEFTVKERTNIARVSEYDDIGDFELRNSAAPVNTKCNVIVAGTSIIDIKEVTIRSNYCTDALQIDLRDGWRILAICVQPDQRRPDYVLGKT